MPPTWGVTAAGFVVQPQSAILAAIEADQQSLIAADIDQSAVVWLGQANGIVSAQLSSVWEILPVPFNATNRGQSEGASLDNTGQLTGTLRAPAAPSTVYATCVFSAAGTYAIGALVGQIANLPSQQAANAVAVVVPSINPVNGMAVSVSNPYTAPGILFSSPNAGPNFANALLAAGLGSFDVLVPVSGWVSLVDTSEPVVGSLEEIDTPYRVRQVQQLGAQGSSTLPGVAAAIVEALAAAPSPVTGASVQMYENTLLTTDIHGLPPKSYMAVVFDGLTPNVAQNDPIIASAVWRTKPAGIQPFGTTSLTVLDSQGVQRIVSFSRASQVPVYLIVHVTVQPQVSAAQAVSLINDAIVAASQGQPFTMYGATVTPPAGSASTLLPGVDVIPSAFGAIAQGQAGVAEQTAVYLGTSPSPTGTLKIRIAPTQIAVIASVTVIVTAFAP